MTAPQLAIDPDEILVIAGPTATGKSGLALEMAPIVNGEIVNADALQVYRRFDIGTAKPTPSERAQVPHHLIDILDPQERYSAGEFVRDATEALDAIRSRRRVPILVGGSGLYLRALLEGMTPMPEVDSTVVTELAEELEHEGLAALRGELEEVDPKTAHRLTQGDTQRTLRALAVYRSTHRPLSEWISAKPFGQARLPARRVGLTLDRALLYDRIEARIGRMIEAGWVDEVRALLASGVDSSVPAFQAIGYKQLAGSVLGESSQTDAVDDTVRATKKFAKRQMTWFRKEPDIHWFDATDPIKSTSEVIKWLKGTSSKTAK